MPEQDAAGSEDSAKDSLGNWVEVSFDCLPLRSVAPVQIPTDASPKFSQKLERLRAAIKKHGTLNTYFLHNATCRYFLTNDPGTGMLEYRFEGVLLTDSNDMLAHSCDLEVELSRETCGWLNQAIANWFADTVQRSVLVDFNRYIRAGDLSRTVERIEKLQRETDESGGFVGMYL